MMISVIFVTGLLLAVFILQTGFETKVDTVAINEVVKEVEKNWNSLKRGDFSNSKYEFSIISKENVLLYTTSDGINHTVNQAIQNRDTIVDVSAGEDYRGKIIFYNNNIDVLERAKSRLVETVLIVFTLFASLGICYILYLYYSVLKPFNTLQNFAKNIARGHLDVPLAMDKSNLFGAFTESFDMMREELAIARDNEYLANRSKKELVASLSHDIKTPVSSIKAISEFMLVTIKDAKAQKQLHTIISKAEQIDRLVTDMFHSTLEDLNELEVKVTEEDSGILNKMIENNNFFGEINKEKLPECLIVTDVLRLQQIFDNVISNSYKYAGGSVDIAFRLTSTHLEVDIKDYGRGISEEELPLVFNKFYRGQNADGRSGSGLGLYISSFLMEKMDGDIQCFNCVDGFIVRLAIKLA